MTLRARSHCTLTGFRQRSSGRARGLHRNGCCRPWCGLTSLYRGPVCKICAVRPLHLWRDTTASAMLLGHVEDFSQEGCLIDVMFVRWRNWMGGGVWTLWLRSSPGLMHELRQSGRGGGWASCVSISFCTSLLGPLPHG